MGAIHQALIATARPSGGGGQPDPGNLAFEWFAETEGLGNTDPVPQLTDTSGNSNHATQGTAGNRGTYVTNALGGKAAVNFDGSNDFYELTSAIGSGQSFTLYVVWKMSSSAGGDHTLIGSGNNGPDYQMWSGDRKNRIGGHSTSNQGKAADTWVQSNIAWQGGANTYAYRTDKVDGNSGTTSNTSWSNAAERIGEKFSTGGQPWHGQLAAILIYTTAHDTTTKQTVEDYISDFFSGAI